MTSARPERPVTSTVPGSTPRVTTSWIGGMCASATARSEGAGIGRSVPSAGREITFFRFRVRITGGTSSGGCEPGSHTMTPR